MASHNDCTNFRASCCTSLPPLCSEGWQGLCGGAPMLTEAREPAPNASGLATSPVLVAGIQLQRGGLRAHADDDGAQRRLECAVFFFQGS